MSDQPSDDLPENLEDWPRDLWALLGVAVGASRDELRRAYRQRLHRYKPERFPREFQRIREAYEQLLRWLPRTEQPADAVPMPPVTLPPRSSDQSVATSAQPDAVAPTDPIAGELERAWDHALHGEPEVAWSRLSELAVSSDHEGVAIRRYWLLRGQPTLSPDELPVDLLYRQLARCPTSSGVGHLLRAEWERWPAETLSPRCEPLLALPLPDRLQRELYRQRWTTCMVQGNWERVHADLDGFLAQTHQKAAFRSELLMLALKICLAAQSSSRTLSDVTVRCLDLLFAEELTSAHLRYYQFGQTAAELEQMLFEEHQRSTNEPPPEFHNPMNNATLMQLVRSAVRLSEDQLRRRLAPFLQAWSSHVAGGLRMLDEFCENYPAHAAELGRLLTSLQSQDFPYERRLFGPELRERLLRDIHFEWRIPRPGPRLTFQEWRTGIVQFCLQEAADFDAVISELQSLMPGLPFQSSLHPAHLQGHLATRCLIEGIQLYGAIPGNEAAVVSSERGASAP